MFYIPYTYFSKVLFRCELAYVEHNNFSLFSDFTNSKAAVVFSLHLRIRLPGMVSKQKHFVQYTGRLSFFLPSELNGNIMVGFRISSRPVIQFNGGVVVLLAARSYRSQQTLAMAKNRFLMVLEHSLRDGDESGISDGLKWDAFCSTT